MIIGIDPGMSGAIAALSISRGGRWSVLDVFDIPILATERTDPLYGYVDVQCARQWVQDTADKHKDPVDQVFVEDQGVYGARLFKTVLLQLGQLISVCDLGGWFGYPIGQQAWHQFVGIKGKKRYRTAKMYSLAAEEAVKRLLNLSPGEFRLLFQTERGRHLDDRIDAALIGYAGYHLIRGGL